MPFLLKDLNVAYAGVPLTNGSRFFADFVPREDSTAVARLRIRTRDAVKSNIGASPAERISSEKWLTRYVFRLAGR